MYRMFCKQKQRRRSPTVFECNIINGQETEGKPWCTFINIIRLISVLETGKMDHVINVHGSCWLVFCEESFCILLKCDGNKCCRKKVAKALMFPEEMNVI